jgi:ABC-type proline/glycine betaine transport system substrate-binding protein
MQNIIITTKSKQSVAFLKKLLSKLDDVKNIEIVEEKEEVPFVVLSESSLAKEWSSEEDDIWDNWAKEKLKIAR